MRIAPTRRQWRGWSLPSKASYVGGVVAVPSLLVALIALLPIWRTNHAVPGARPEQRTQWKADSQKKAATEPMEPPAPSTPDTVTHSEARPPRRAGKRTDASTQEGKARPTQIMQNSPGGVQIGGDLNVNVNMARRLSSAAARLLVDGLKAEPCIVTVGVLGMGGEPDRLANEILEAAKQAGGEVRGVNHGVGFQSFTGIQVRYSPVNTSMVALQSIINALTTAKLEYVAGADGSQPPGSVYIYVGYKP